MKSKNVLVSIVMPYLNEQETLGPCIKKAQYTLETIGIQDEVVVADNRSTDDSTKIAKRLATYVRYQPLPGPVLLLHRDTTSSWETLTILMISQTLRGSLHPLRDGYDLVIGNRFSGKMQSDAMPWANRYIGNLTLSGLPRFLFRIHIAVSHCGMRSFTAEAYTRMAWQTINMESASEMVVKAVQENLKICEIPIDYAPCRGIKTQPNTGCLETHPLPIQISTHA